MKKYLFGIAALALAIGFSAFKASTLVPVTLQFVGSDPADYSQVTNEQLWQQVTITCGGGSQKPCTIEVESTDVTVASPNNYLNASRITLDASLNSFGFYEPFKLSGVGGDINELILKD